MLREALKRFLILMILCGLMALLFFLFQTPALAEKNDFESDFKRWEQDSKDPALMCEAGCSQMATELAQSAVSKPLRPGDTSDKAWKRIRRLLTSCNLRCNR